jgi:hypothetical protein
MELSRRIVVPDVFQGLPSTEPLHRLSDRLLASDNILATLQARCVECGIGSGPVVVDRWAISRLRMPDPAMEEALRLGHGESVRVLREFYRRGHIALAELRTCFVPERLTPAMRHSLATTDTAFGPVVEAMRPRRSAIHVTFGRDGIEHRTVLAPPGAAPVAVVLERFRPVLG